MNARLKLALLLLVAVVVPVSAFARVGGGHSYSGGSRSSGSSSSSSRSSGSSSWSSSSSRSSGSSSWSSSRTTYSGEPSDCSGSGLALLVVLVVVVVVFSNLARKLNSDDGGYQPTDTPTPTAQFDQSIAERVREKDPSFSEPVFLEWATLLYVRAMQARGFPKSLEAIAPWFMEPEAQLNDRLGTFAAKHVRGVVVGSQQLSSFRVTGEALQLSVLFQACLTAQLDDREQALYVHQVWTFQRKLGVQSRTPDTITREGCPNCGAPFERTTAGRCTSCDASLTPGESDWFVQSIRTRRAEASPPLLGGYAEEVGTDRRTLFDRDLNRATLQFDRDRFLERARTIFLNLQQSWSDQNAAALRPYETEAIYQSHRFWLEEYQRQGVRNLLTQVQLTKVEIVKIASDAAYEAVTCRLHASMIDVTVKGPKRTVVGGDATTPRSFTEYWTFLRRPGAKGGTDDAKCPNCGAPLKINQAGVCEYCQAVITRGEFDWVLTRIEQDEDYTG